MPLSPIDTAGWKSEVQLLGRTTSSQQPSLSVLVRVKNEMKALPHFWRALESQTIFDRIEVIFLDSGSTDGTLDFLASIPCWFYALHGPFSFGRSCNQIAALATAPILVFLSGHVLLVQNDVLEQIAGLLRQNELAAAYVRQIPNELLGYSSYEAAQLARRFPSGDHSVQIYQPLSFSNAASAISRGAWERQPFQEINGSEDFFWAQQHLRSGGALFYMPQRQVMHSHQETPEQVYQRVRINVDARSLAHSYGKAAFKFAGVYVSMLRFGASHREALCYARAHGRAYL